MWPVLPSPAAPPAQEPHMLTSPLSIGSSGLSRLWAPCSRLGAALNKDGSPETVQMDLHQRGQRGDAFK